MMRNLSRLGRKLTPKTFSRFMKPARKRLKTAPSLESRGDRPLQMTFEDQLNALVYFHLEEFSSGRALIQALDENDFARQQIAPEGGIQKSSFFEAMSERGIEQLHHLFNGLVADVARIVPKHHAHLGDLQAIDGSLVDAVLSMAWAQYRDGSKKAKVHLGFDIRRGVPSRVFLSEGKADERPFASQLLEPGQTGVMDRYYQCHRDFDQWQREGKHFVCRIRAGTRKTEIHSHPTAPDSHVFSDTLCLLGTKGQNQTEQPVRVVGYRVGKKSYWVATDRHDLAAEDVALAYKLRWNIEIFFGWWKRHLKVYHLISRSRHGLMVQILAGLITDLLLAIYCHEEYGEKVSIKRVRELRHKIQNEAAQLAADELQSQPGEIQPGDGLPTAIT